MTTVSWPLQDAKQKLSELIDRTLTEGPQTVTRRGDRAVVVVAADEYDRLTGKTQSFKDFLLGPPYVDDELEIYRDTSPTRKVEFE